MSKSTVLPYALDLGSLGQIEGLTLTSPTTSKSQCHYIGGLPYALPPIGPYRFRPPRPLPAHHRYGTRANPGRFACRTALCPQPTYGAAPEKAPWDEDCLQLNIWIPAGEAPMNGWPVFFYIHGGWLQFGTANTPPEVGAKLLSETTFEAVIVMPSYRLNAFGFLASKELETEARENGESVGNMGFWDQRMALEWTSRNIGRFGGNRDLITVGGYSAGSHSAFQQLSHDLDRPKEEAIINRVIMWSNGTGVQAKFLPEAQEQFDELLGVLGIPLDCSAEEKLTKLRNVPADRLVEVQSRLKISEFRAVSDGAFVNKQKIESIEDGTFARKLKERGIKILNGECAEEWNVYGSWRTPANSYEAVEIRLCADYPKKVVQKLMPIYFPAQRLPDKYKDWVDAFGKVYADLQVYALERGLADRLTKGGLTVGKDLLRYRIEWRAKCIDTIVPPEWGVTHSTDMAIWFWGNGTGDGLTADEKRTLAPWTELFSRFVKGEDVQWPLKGPKSVLRLTVDGKTEMCEDHLWDHGLAIWKAVNGKGDRSQAKL